MVQVLQTGTAGLDGMTERPAAGVVVVMPAIDMAQAQAAAARMLRLAGTESPPALLIVEDRARLGFIAVVNAVCAACRPEHLAYVAQDALAGRDWLRHALSRLSGTGRSLCALNDGIWQGAVAQFGVLRCAFFEEVYGAGQVFYPGYRRHRADEEITHYAHHAGQLCFDPRALMMEVDYRPARPIDPEDSALYFRRKPGVRQAALARAAAQG
ncbi:MAG: hypothetical protein RIT14_2940 [Pseudomonadota bacterium]|jgi:hypothetical protein